MGKSNTEQLKIAQKYLGQGGATFRKFCGLPSGAAWCDAFVSYIFYEAGNASLFCGGKKQTYCPTTIKLLAKELAQVPIYLAMPSDVIFFDWENNGTPNHIGFVREHKDTASIYTTEGNTSNKVMNKTRPAKYVQAIYRPRFVPSKMPSKGKLGIDGNFAYRSIMMLQIVLGLKATCILDKSTVMALQKKAGLSGKSVDGAWGPTTSLYIQRMLIKAGLLGKGGDDKQFGKQSTMALQKWINNQYAASQKPAATKPAAPSKPATPAPITNAQKIVNKANELAWPYGTPSSKWDYKKGSPTAKCKAAMNKLGYSTKEKWSDCGRAATTIVRASGVDPNFVAMVGVKEPFPKSSKFNIVLSGKRIPANFLKAGDIVRYKKTKGQHTLIYMGNGRVCEARHYKRFCNIYKDEKRYDKASTKAKSIQVLRAK